MIYTLLAQTRIGRFNGLGKIGETCEITFPGGTCAVTTDPVNKFALILSQIIGVLTIIAALWFIFTLFTGAIAWVSAGSDKQALDNAKKKITNGLIGLFITVAAYALIGVIGYFLGIDIINLSELINNVVPK